MTDTKPAEGTAADIVERLKNAQQKLHRPLDWPADHEALQRLLTACTALLEGRGWMPIETAPKDGTRVLAHRPGWADSIGVAWWSQTWGEWCSVPGTYRWTPSHWQPLPSPPPAEDAQRDNSSLTPRDAPSDERPKLILNQAALDWLKAWEVEGSQAFWDFSKWTAIEKFRQFIRDRQHEIDNAAS